MPRHPERRLGQPAKPPFRERYKPVGYANVLFAHAPAIMMIHKEGLVAAGLGYERFLSRRGTLSLAVSAYGYQTFFYGKFDGPSLKVSGFQGVTMVMYHPFGNRRRLYDLSAGVGMAVGKHRRTLDTQGYPGPQRISIEEGPLSAILEKLAVTLHSPKNSFSVFIFRLERCYSPLTGNASLSLAASHSAADSDLPRRTRVTVERGKGRDISYIKSLPASVHFDPAKRTPTRRETRWYFSNLIQSSYG